MLTKLACSHTLLNGHDLLEAIVILLSDVIFSLIAITLQVNPGSLGRFRRSFSLPSLIIKSVLIINAVIFEFPVMMLKRINLRIENEPLAIDVKLSPFLFNCKLVKILTHLHILLFQKQDVLV